MPAKAKIPPILWVVFAIVDLAILGAVLAAVFWVAPVPRAFAAGHTLTEARAAHPSGLAVAVVTADYCLACQMYKRGALADDRFTDWVTENAGATYLKWGRDDAEIASLHVDRYPATVVMVGDDILATHFGGMTADELMGLLERAAASLAEARGAEGATPPAVEPGAAPDPAPQPTPDVPASGE